ncbi:MAG: hypothetical protein EPN93_11185 [Spirochaetes bacterium]|nr:MAG: hypothetical protein EPN93_11185 [Spirochaetota bacterium]
MKGFGDLYRESPWLFSSLCGTFVLIAILGIAITPAEKELLAEADNGLATWGSNLAYLGHMGTIAFFSWWIIFANLNHNQADVSLATVLVPIKWGIMFELFFVGAWVWIIAYVVFRHGILSRNFGLVSIAKATSFWFAFCAFLLNEKLLLVAGIVLVAVIFGPWWHMWISVRFFLRHEKEEK